MYKLINIIIIIILIIILYFLYFSNKMCFVMQNDKLLEYGTISNNKRNGLWYYINKNDGKDLYCCEFKNDLKEGTWIYIASGYHIEWEFKNDSLNGVAKIFNPLNNELKVSYYYKNNIEKSIYYPNRNLTLPGTFTSMLMDEFEPINLKSTEYQVIYVNKYSYIIKIGISVIFLLLVFEIILLKRHRK